MVSVCADDGVIKLEDEDEPAELLERVAALDVGKVVLVGCVRVPSEDRPGRGVSGSS